MKAKKILTYIDILLIALTVVFIISNSLVGSEASNSTSQSITDQVIENVKPVQDAISDDRLTEEDLHVFVRKFAHVFEYAILGAEMMALLLLLFPAEPFKHLIYILFSGILLAACDETVQSFTARTSSGVDVLIDFGGICIGIALAYFIPLLVRAVCRAVKKTR